MRNEAPAPENARGDGGPWGTGHRLLACFECSPRRSVAWRGKLFVQQGLADELPELALEHLALRAQPIAGLPFVRVERLAALLARGIPVVGVEHPDRFVIGFPAANALGPWGVFTGHDGTSYWREHLPP